MLFANRMCERIFVRKDDTTVYKARCMLERNETSERIAGPFSGADDEVPVQSRGELQGAKNNN